MKIGAMVPQGWRMDLNGIKPEKQWDAILEASTKIEKLKFESVWVYDHFHTVPSPTQDPTFECWSLMAALSQVTSEVRIGQMCTCNSYRNPAYLTKVASSIDAMSGGRLEFAIGAGWYDQEYKAYGYEYPSAGVRLKMLEEALETGEFVSGKIHNRVKGGFAVEIDVVKAFLPGSLVDVRPVKEAPDIENTI